MERTRIKTCTSSCRSGLCLAFGPDGSADLTIRPGDSWQSIVEAFPDGWQPDFLGLNLAYGFVPPVLWNVPLPRIALATDWNLLWHYYRGRLPACDLVLTDSRGAELMAREGFPACAAALCGCEQMFVDRGKELSAKPSSQTGLRDIDVLFVGNLNPNVQRERAPWLTRLARLGKRWRVRIRTGSFGQPYLRLLERARIVIQFSARGKAGRRGFEAANAGALIFQEEGNSEVPAYFRDRQECVYFTPENLEDLLAYYLDHEPERQGLTEAARIRAQSCRFVDLWQAEVDEIENEWPRLRDRAGLPTIADAWQDLSTRAWQALTASRFDDLSLVSHLEHALNAGTDVAGLANLAGCMLWRQGRGRTPANVLSDMAAVFFRRALAVQPSFALAGLNLAETLESGGLRAEAIGTARQTLQTIQRAAELDHDSREGMPLCQPFDCFHVEWERAAWTAGRPEDEGRAKRDLLLWKLNSLLAAWTGELSHAYEAAVRRPDLASSLASLGAALVRNNQGRDALEHLRRALSANPLDRESARGCFQVLGNTGDADGRERLCEDRRLLSRRSAGHPAGELVCRAPATRQRAGIDHRAMRRTPRLHPTLSGEPAEPLSSALRADSCP